MQRLQLDIFVPVFVDQPDGVRIEMFTIRVSGAGEIRRGRVSKIQLVAVTLLVVRIHPSPSVQCVLVLLSSHMAMTVRACEPCSQQGDTDQQDNSRGCLAEAIQHFK
ncbi:MAG: hypothetical protein ACSLE5_03960 [Porticoccaceae bacterium]